ncbi:MAG TPA: hypothetical protein VFH73_19660 [Polyangia bacterium]|jgi:hypothetical protein|nr:hypothetical protein [Polyangia bacterium]
MAKPRTRAGRVPSAEAAPANGVLGHQLDEIGLPPEVTPDDERGTEPVAVRDVGDADELSAHGPEGDGDLDTQGADGQGLPTDQDEATELEDI